MEPYGISLSLCNLFYLVPRGYYAKENLEF